MTKAKLVAIDSSKLSEIAAGRDSRRNVIGILKKDLLDSFIADFIKACEEAGVSGSSWTKHIGFRKEHRLQINNEDLQKEIDALNTRPVGPLGLFFSEYTIYQPGGNKIKDPEHLVLLIYYTINKKALTRFRNFLLTNIIVVESKEELK